VYLPHTAERLFLPTSINTSMQNSHQKREKAAKKGTPHPSSKNTSPHF